jgi:DNA (cytosine-5)-methyltransferase 1
MKIKHASLFTGIAGFDLAAEWMGWDNVFQVENNPKCIKLLNTHFPNTDKYGDIKTFNASPYRGTIDVISGGAPCQPFSSAGEQRSTEDNRYLWPEMFRIIREVKSPFVVFENVTGIINLALDTVLSDLESENYTTESFVIPACAKNAWHRRDRVWVIAYANSYRREESFKGGQSEFIDSYVKARATDTDTNNGRGKVQKAEQEFSEMRDRNEPTRSDWWESEPEICRVADGLSGELDQLHALGNAIVPQIAYELFKPIDLLLRSQCS